MFLGTCNRHVPPSRSRSLTTRSKADAADGKTGWRPSLTLSSSPSPRLSTPEYWIIDPERDALLHSFLRSQI